MKRVEIIALAVVLLSFLVAAFSYPLMPDEIASHWNAQGQVNGYMSKFWGLFFVPILSAVLLVFFMLIPKIDPLKENIKKFRGFFNNFVLLIMLFLFYVYLLTIVWNLGFVFDMTYLLIPPLGILLFYAGVMMEKSKRNWFIGVRTPWTISDERVWDKTNKLGGKLFKISGIIAVLGVLVPRLTILLLIVPVILSGLYTTVYSYFEWKRLNRGNMRRR